MHLLDLLTHTPQFLLDLEQVVNVIAFLFQHVDQALFHHARIFQARFGVEVRFGHVLRAEGLIFQFAQPANFLKKPVEIFWQNLYDDLAFQFSVCLLFRTCRRHITAFFIRECRDLLNCVIKTSNFKLDLRVTYELAIHT